MWNTIQYVTSGLTLVAFIAAAGISLFSRAKRSRADVIETARPKDRGALVEQALKDEHVNVEAVPPDERAGVILEILRTRARRYRINAIVICFVATLTSAIAVYSVYQSSAVPALAASREREVTHEPVSVDIQSASPANRDVASRPTALPSTQSTPQPEEPPKAELIGLCSFLQNGAPTERSPAEWSNMLGLRWVMPNERADIPHEIPFQTPVPECESVSSAWGCKWTGTRRDAFEQTYRLAKQDIIGCIGREEKSAVTESGWWRAVWQHPSDRITVLELERPNEGIEFEIYPYQLTILQNREVTANTQ